jgi:hypothetical protein
MLRIGFSSIVTVVELVAPPEVPIKPGTTIHLPSLVILVTFGVSAIGIEMFHIAV